jgi:two-component system nitrogen regulation sensor histidine kinase NtrY
MPATQLTSNDINQIISEALVLYQEGHKDIKFSFFPDPAIPIINLDRDQLKRAVINLLDNAVGSIEDHGAIVIESTYTPSLQMVTFTISDTGCGIPAEDKPRLFEPYFSTKKSGTGLGLAIVSTIISDHNGYIRVKDNIPTGTKFIVELPILGT